MIVRITTILLLFAPSLWGQNKLEVEHRVKIDQVPTLALTFANSLSITGKVRWYYEENLKGNSYEAKIKDTYRYSIEFDTLGNFQDIEIKISLKDIQASTQAKIKENIESIFDRYKIRKTQIQFFEEDIVHEVLQGSSFQMEYPHRFEIVLEGRKKKVRKLYEITFDNFGEMIKTEEIIPLNSDLLEY